MDKIVKPGIVLFVICAIAAGLLGYIYDITEEPIKVQNENTLNKAMEEVLPEAKEFNDLQLSSDEVVSVYEGKNGDEVVGYAITTAPSGYGGPVNILTGVKPDGTITSISILSMTETPGLGANASEPSFKDQYNNKSGELTVVKTVPSKDNEIEAMTSATITSRAVTNGVNASTRFFEENIKGAK